jgi:hypothetical protein
MPDNTGIMLSNTPYRFKRGPSRLLSPARTFVSDLCYFAKQVPSVPVERRMHLSDVMEARARWPERASWRAIFTKAMAILSARRPELRQAYLKFPVARIYDASAIIANIAFERDTNGTKSVHIGRVIQPEQLSLAEIDQVLREFQDRPINEIPQFRTQLLLSRMPWPVRWLVWWAGLNASGLYRQWFFGTYAVSVVAALGASSLHPLSPLTTILNYSPFDKNGALDVRLIYDHRVMDGAEVARMLAELDAILHTEILAELQSVRAAA